VQFRRCSNSNGVGGAAATTVVSVPLSEGAEVAAQFRVTTASLMKAETDDVGADGLGTVVLTEKNSVL
jgi:hypothetical protein